MSVAVPTRIQDITAEYLTGLVSEIRPGIHVESVDILRVRGYGDADNELSVSTSDQISMELKYNQGAPNDLPTRLLAKMSFAEDMECSNPELEALFENEVLFYNRIRPDLSIETPLGLGGAYDAHNKRFILLMEDLSPRSPHINSMMNDDDFAVVEAVLDTYARLHATYWESPRFQTDMAWVQNQVSGSIEQMFDGSIRQHVINEMQRERFKTEFAQELGMTEEEMFFGEKALKRHHATFPQTFLHGDAHFANTYVLPDGTGGLLDWQVSTSGFYMFDICYFIQTALSVEGRRNKERELLAFYHDRLRAHGVVNAPDAETAWLEYRRSLHHGFYLGWLTAPRENYGWEVMVTGNHRTKAACMDHDSRKLILELL